VVADLREPGTNTSPTIGHEVYGLELLDELDRATLAVFGVTPGRAIFVHRQGVRR
jgi:hypothetical protein